MMNDMAKEGDMKGTSNKKFVPELRFPEFEKDGEWHREKLCNIANTFSGGTPSVNNRDYYNGVIPFIRSGEINNTITELSLTHLGVEKSSAKIVEKGTILYALYGATSGEVAISKIRGAINQAILAIILNATYSTRYVYQFLKKEKAGIINQFLQGGQGNLSGTIVNNLSIPFPSYIEQQKIAECLSSIDEEISAIEEKVEQLKAHKKGLMQKLFPVAGKFVPDLRFPEFKKESEWKEMTLGEVFERVSEKNVNNNQNVLTISAQYGLVSQYDYFNKNVAAANIKSYYFIHKGDFAYNKSRSQGYPFGVIKPLRRYDSGVVSTLYTCFRAKTNCCIDFYEQYFDTDLINVEISKIAQEGARNHGLLNISIDDFFNKIKILVPHSSEQQKIAECLSSIDELIILYENKVTLLEQHKKGLMQQLFPKL